MSNLPNDMRKLAEDISHAIEHTIPRKFGKEGQDYFEDSFTKQAWDGAPWEEVKRRNPSSQWYGFSAGATSKRPGRARRKPRSITNYSPAATKRKILIGESAELSSSIRHRIMSGGKIVWTTDKVYAQAHNEGATIKVFGKYSATLKRRQFMGFSKELDRKFDQIVEKEIGKVFNKQ